MHHGITVVLITRGSGNEVGGRGGVVHHEIQALREEVPLKSRTSLVDESPCQIELERNLLFVVCVCVCVCVFVCVCVCVCVFVCTDDTPARQDGFACALGDFGHSYILNQVFVPVELKLE